MISAGTLLVESLLVILDQMITKQDVNLIDVHRAHEGVGSGARVAPMLEAPHTSSFQPWQLG